MLYIKLRVNPLTEIVAVVSAAGPAAAVLR
jgi:hypothetical protein